MDSLIFEMEKLLVSGSKDRDIQNIIDEFAGKNIDDLLIEADKLIYETQPYFQTTSNQNKVKTSTDFESYNQTIKSETIQLKYLKNDTNKVPDVNFMKTQLLQVSSTVLENHNRLQVMCNRHDELVSKIETRDHIDKLKTEEELNYYKLKNNELEKKLKTKEQEINSWEIRYHQLNQFCESFSKRNMGETLRSFDCKLNELFEHNLARESQLQTIISSLLKEIDQSHLQFRIKLSEKNKQIHKYLDLIEKILNNVYGLRN